jgi:hypothetical protein
MQWFHGRTRRAQLLEDGADIILDASLTGFLRLKICFDVSV